MRGANDVLTCFTLTLADVNELSLKYGQQAEASSVSGAQGVCLQVDDGVGAQYFGRQERTTCFYRGYKHTRAWASSKKVVYRCSQFRQGCRGTMEYVVATMGYSSARAHTCQDVLVASSIVDVTDEMKARADSLAINRVALPARQIWEELRGSIYSADNANVVRGLSEEQVLRRVRHAGNRHFSGDVHGAVEIPPFSLALNEAASFFSSTTLQSTAKI